LKRDYVKLALIAMVVIFAVLFLLERSCGDPNGKIGELKGQLQAYKEETEEKEQALKKEMEDKNIQIAKKDEEILTLRTEISKEEEERAVLKRKDDEKDDRIRKLKTELETLTSEDLIISNLKNQIKEWEERFWNEREDKNKADENIRRWAAVAFKQEQKYLKEKQAVKMLLDQMARKDRQLEIADKLNIKYEKELRGIKIKQTLKSVLYNAGFFLGGYVLGGQ